MAATLLGADGRPLRASKPSGDVPALGWFSSSLANRWTDATEDVDHAYLKSFEEIYRSQPVIAGVVDKLSRRFASLPLDTYKRLPKNRREQVFGDSLDTLLAKPWPRGSRLQLLAHIFQSLLIHANAMAVKVRLQGGDAAPDMLIPLDWRHLSAYAPQGSRIEWWSTTQFGPERFFRAQDAIHFAWPAPDGSDVGVSPLEKLGVTLRLEDATQRFQTASFRNGVRPSLAVTLDQPNPSKDVLDFARAKVETMHKGVDQNAKAFFMGANVKVQPLSLSPVEAALIEQRHVNWEEVGMVYDLAGPLMGDLRHATFSNVTEFLRSLYRDVAPPWLELVTSTLQAQLIDEQPEWLDRFVAFDLTDKLKGDPVELAQSLKMQVEAGLVTRNEARRILNMEPDGDPDDPENPANQLSANTNNQASIQTMAVGNQADQGAPALPPAASPAPLGDTER